MFVPPSFGDVNPEWHHTHTIVGMSGHRIPVMAWPGWDIDLENPFGYVLYTREEWDAEINADWETDSTGEAIFQGGITHHAVEGPPLAEEQEAQPSKTH